ncbi:unnamed protein product [Auanema sp. JU1783]|nr:unnamed protein product [Auanema sp. JU1783]
MNNVDLLQTEPGCSTTTCSSFRVRDLARRFEPASSQYDKPRPVPTKRIGKFRMSESALTYKSSQAPVRVGIVRKKSSLKRRSSSTQDLNLIRRDCSLKKSNSSNFPQSTACESSNNNSVIEKSYVRPSRLSVEVEKRPTPLPTPRLRGVKPQPPAKPARLLSSPQPASSCSTTSELTQELQTVSSDDRQPPVQPDSSGSVNIMLTVPSKTTSLNRPRCPPPAPPKPPSRERLQRIPSYRAPGTVHQMATSTPKARPLPKLSNSSDDENYQQMPHIVPTIPPKKPVRFEQRRQTKDIPRVPSISPPKTPSHEYSDDSQCYEEIGTEEFAKQNQLLMEPSTSTTSRSLSSSGYSVNTDANSSSNYNYVTNIVCEDSSSPKKSRRPVSTIEFDKLIKFKSDIQLNLSKKMDQLRQKVGDRRPRHSNKSRLPSEDNVMTSSAHHDPSYQTTDDDRYIYGDDWSSDEDEVFDDQRSSMYKEIEEHLNKTFPNTMNNEGIYATAEPLTRPDELPIEKMSLEDHHDALDDSSPEYSYGQQYTSRLPIEPPLYQLYMLGEQEKLVDDAILPEPSVVVDRATIEVGEAPMKSRRESSVSSDSGRGADCSTSASALTSNTSMRRERLVAGSHFGSQRSLWCELAEVKSAGLLETLDEDTKLLQEAYFEVITSEASYLRSLNILITHFMASQEMLGSKSPSSVISNADRKHLFSNIFAVRDCSEKLLCDLETRLEENLVLDDICDILVEHFEKHFDVYIKYCSNQVYQDRTLRRLKTENHGFLTSVSRLEADRQCQGLDMRSFLMLPMQRITRYPLLLYAIIDRVNTEADRYKTVSKGLLLANKVVRECNEGARRMERTEQLLEVDKRLVYKDPDLKRIPLVSNSRHLVKRGTLTQLVERRTKGLLQGRQKARSIHVFLFSDIIMITKKKINGTYVCKDYASRPYVDIEPIEPDNPRIPPGVISSLATRPHLFLCVLMRNARGKQTELLLNAESETDRERWLSAIRPPTSSNPEEKVYPEWDCPQCIVVHPYAKSQDDELNLQVGDMINILRKMPDGWYYGERCRDNVGGWFPSSYIQQVLNDHVRANNYRHRLRLIQAASGITRGNVGRGTSPFMDRLRRMSNPRQLFQAGIGL